MKGGGTSVAPIYAGVRTDIEKLLEKFLDKPTVRYQHFEACFQDMQLSLIFAGRNTENELREFEEKVLMIALSYCFPPYSYQAQVGAVYLLYAFYYLQPNKYRMKIRITLPMLTSMYELLNTLRGDQHLDAFYVLNRLFYDDAFFICMYPEEHNPMTYRRFDCKDDLERATKTLRSGKSAMDELVDDPVMEQLQTLHDQYSMMKFALFNGEDQLPDSLSLVTNPLTDYVKGAVKDCEDRLERRFGNKTRKRHESGEKDEASPHKAKRKEGRAEIRERAYAAVNNQGRFHRKKTPRK